MSEMLSGGANPIDPAGDTDQVIGAGRQRGGKPQLIRGGKKKGWGDLHRGAVIAYRLFSLGPHAKELGIGMVNSNSRETQRVQIQPCRPVWVGAGLTFKPLYASRGELSIDPREGLPEEKTVLYCSIVMQVQLHQGGTLFSSNVSELTERGSGLDRENDQVAAVETVNYFRAAGEEHVRDKIAALSELADETAVWQPHSDGNCAMTLGTDAITPVFRFESTEKDSACDRILKIGSAKRKGSAPLDGAVSQETLSFEDREVVPGPPGPECSQVPESITEAEVPDRPPNLRTVSEARALEAERPLTAEEARKCAAHSRGRAPQGSKMSPGQLAWMRRLESGDLTGNGVPEASFLPLRNQEALLEDVR